MTADLDTRARQAADAMKTSAARSDTDALLARIEGRSPERPRWVVPAVALGATAAVVAGAVVGLPRILDSQPQVPDVVQTPPEVTPTDGETGTGDPTPGRTRLAAGTPIDLGDGFATGISPDGTHAYVSVIVSPDGGCEGGPVSETRRIEIATGAVRELGEGLATDGRIIARNGRAFVLEQCEEFANRMLVADQAPDGSLSNIVEIPFEQPTDGLGLFGARWNADATAILAVRQPGADGAQVVEWDPLTGEETVIELWPRAFSAGQLPNGTYVIAGQDGVTIRWSFDDVSTLAGFNDFAIAENGTLLVTSTQGGPDHGVIAYIRTPDTPEDNQLGPFVRLSDKPSWSPAIAADGSVAAFEGAVDVDGGPPTKVTAISLGDDRSELVVSEGGFGQVFVAPAGTGVLTTEGTGGEAATFSAVWTPLVRSTTTQPGPADDPQAAECAAEPRDANVTGIPAAAAAMAERIALLASMCDAEALADLALSEDTNVSFGGTPERDVLVDWMLAEADTLTILLSLEPTSLGNDDPAGPMWVWPPVFADATEENIMNLAGTGLYTEAEIRESIEVIGGYALYRIGITSDGTWAFFVAGD